MCSLLPSSVTVDRHVFVQTGYWCKKVYWSFMWFGCYWGLVSSITKLYVASIGIYEKFASAFIKAVQSLHVGNGLEESTSQVQSSYNYHFQHDKWSSCISSLFFLCLLLKHYFAFKVYELFKPNITVLTKLSFTFFCCHALIFLMCSVLYFVYLIWYFFSIYNFIYPWLRSSSSFHMQGPLINEAAVQKVHILPTNKPHAT